MTLVHTPYTLLEDAWGSNFDNDTKKKKTKKPKKQSDPLCELYNKRYKKIKKPFYNKDSDMLENDYFHQVHSFKGGKDNNMYLGYKDDDFTRLANAERQQTNTLMIDENGHCIDTYNSVAVDKMNNSPSAKKRNTMKKKKPKKVTFNIEPEDEDDMYFEQAILSEEQEEQENDYDINELIPSESFEDIVDTQQGSFDRIYSNVYEETDDELDLEESEDVLKNEPVVCEENVSQKSISELIEDEIKKNSYLKSLQRDRQVAFVDERQYLDLLMYMFSGIILIFIMEQFIQIGIKMKTPIY